MHNHPFRPARTLLYLSIAQERALGCEYPIGDPWGGPAFGEKNKGGVFSQTYWEKGGIVNSVSSLVTNPIGYTNDRLKELDKTVIQPIGNGLEKAGQAIASDPENFALMLAASLTQQWYIVAAMAMVISAGKGNDWDKVLTDGAIAGATTFVAVEGGGMLMETMKTSAGAMAPYAIAGVELSKNTATIIANTASYTASSALAAAATGKNVGEAALQGAITGGLISSIQGVDILKDFSAAIDGVAAKGVGSAITNAISGAAGTMLSGIVTGKDMSTQAGMALVGGAVNGLAAAIEVSGNFFSSNAAEAMDLVYDDYGPTKNPTVAQYLTDKLGPVGAGFVTNAVTSILTSTFTKGDPSTFLAQQILGNLTQSIKNAFDPNFKARYVDPLTGLMDDAKDAATRYNDLANKQNDLGNEINANVTSYNDRVAAVNEVMRQREALAAQYNGYTSANSSQAQVNDTYAKIQALDNQIKAEVTSLNSFYQTGIVDKQAQYDALVPQTTEAQKTYTSFSEALGESAVPLTKYINDVTKDMAIKTAQTLDPSFNPEEYRTINGLSSTDDVGAHYISTGKDQGLYTNFEASRPQQEAAEFKAMDKYAASMGYPGGALSMPPNLYNDALDKIKGVLGNNLKAWENFTVDSFLQQTKLPPTAIMPMWEAEAGKMTVLKTVFDGSEEKLANVTIDLPKGNELASAEQILSGQADVIRGDDGKFYWTVATNTVKAYDSQTGNMVDAYTGSNLTKAPAGATDVKYNADGTVASYRNAEGILQVSIAGTQKDTPAVDVVVTAPRTGTKFDDLDPYQQVEFFGSVDKNILGQIAPQLTETKGAIDTVLKWADTRAKEFMKDSPGLMAIAGTIYGAAPEYIKAWNGLSIYSDADPTSTKLYRFADGIEKMAESMMPEDYNKAWDSVKSSIKAIKDDNSKDWTDVVSKWYDNFTENPTVTLNELGVKELIQEIPDLVLAKGASMLVPGGWSKVAATAAYVTSDVLQSTGDSAASSYAETTKTLTELVKAGKLDMTQEQIHQEALEVAKYSGVIGGGATAIMNKLGLSFLPTEMERDVRKGIIGFVSDVYTGVKSTAKEILGENVEELTPAGYLEARLAQYDPSRDWKKELADVSVQTTVGAGTVAGTLSIGTPTAEAAIDAVKYSTLKANTAFNQAVQSNDGTLSQLGSVFKSWGVPAEVTVNMLPDIVEESPAILDSYTSAADLDNALKSSFQLDAIQAANIANIKFNTQVTTADEAKTALLNAGLTNVTNQDAVNAGLVGVDPANEYKSKLLKEPPNPMMGYTAVQPRQGYEYRYLADGTRIEVRSDTGLPDNAPTMPTMEDKAAQYVNSQMVSEAELRAAAAQENYAVTQDELNKLVGRGVQADVIAKFIAEVDPKAVTQAEAAQYFQDLGYTKATAADIAQFTQSAPEEAMKTAVAEWVNPRQVTRAEALQFFSQLGYTPSEAEITQFVVQGPEVFQDAIKTQLGEYVDPRYVDAAEVREAFKNMGLNAPVAASDLLRLSGQYSESELAGKAQAELPVVSSNAVYALMAGDAAVGQQVKADILAKIEEYKNLGLDQAAAQKAATDAVAAQLGTTQSNLMSAIGATESTLLEKLQSQEEKFNEGLLGVQTDLANAKSTILTQMQAYEQAGLDRDTALNLAISGVAQDLGVAKTDLLAQMGTSEAALRSEIGTTKTELTQNINQVAQVVGKPASQVTQADIDAVNAMLSGQSAANLAYDTNNDGKIDQTDITNIQNQLRIQQGTGITTTVDPNTGLTVYTDTTTGQEITPPTLGGTQWAPTGIYSVLEEQKAQQAATAKAQAASAKEAQRKQNFSQMMQMVLGAPDIGGQQVSVKTPDPSRINYIYDWSSIFATPQQASLMPSPYGPVNTYGATQQPKAAMGGLGGLYGQAANQGQYKMAVGGFAEGGMIGGDISVGDGGSVDDLLNILKGNSG